MSASLTSRENAPVTDGHRIVTSTDSAQWDAFVDQHPDASIYHTSTWRDIIQNTFSKETFYLASVDSKNNVRGVLPLVRLKSLFLGDRLVSMPYCNDGGALADSHDVKMALQQEAIDVGSRLGSTGLEIRNAPEAVDSSMVLRTDKVRMLLDLPGSSEELGKALGSKRRSQIRRSQRSNPNTVVGGAELIRDFYTVFCRNMRDLGTPVYPIRFFHNIVEKWPDNTFIVAIYIDGKPVAAAFLVSYREAMEIPWASSLREFNSMAVNMLLYWEALGFAIDRGCKTFDFGRCTRNEGTYRFKKQWGSVEVPLYWQTRVYNRFDAVQKSDDDRKRQLVANIWSRLPLSVANFVGPRITSNLPW